MLVGLAYENGFLDELGYYLIKRACLDAQTMAKLLKKDVCLSVNISSQADQEQWIFRHGSHSDPAVSRRSHPPRFRDHGTGGNGNIG